MNQTSYQDYSQHTTSRVCCNEQSAYQTASAEMSTTPTLYMLGTHILEVSDEQTITLADEHVALRLESEEAYRLLQVLHTVFIREA